MISVTAPDRRRLQGDEDVCRVLHHPAGLHQLQTLHLHQPALPSTGGKHTLIHVFHLQVANIAYTCITPTGGKHTLKHVYHLQVANIFLNMYYTYRWQTYA